jgi:hypothetical protein
MKTIRRLQCGLILGMLALIPAEAADKTWENLRRLNPGDSIEVVVKDHKEKGTFVSTTAETLTIKTSSGETSLARPDVTRVTSKSGFHRARNILLGIGIGAAIALTIDATLGTILRNESNPPNARAVIWTVPIAAGAGVGAALPSKQTIYKK